MQSGRKFLWMDVIKVFSTFLIVLQHSISGSFTTLPVDGSEWKILNGIFMISRMGVPVFLMCSGAGILAREHTIREIWRKNILGLMKVYLGWMAVLGIWDVLRIWMEGDNVGLRVLVNAFLKCLLFGKYHTWFIFTLLGLYAVTPLLYPIVQRKELLVYFLGLSLLFTVLLPLFYRIEWLDRALAVADSIHMQFVVGYSLYFLAGYFICWCMERKWERYAGIIWIVSAATAYLLSVRDSLQAGMADHAAYEIFSPCGFLMSVTLMILFRKWIGQESASRELNRAAGLQKYGIAVYLFHVVFVEAWTEESGMISILLAAGIWGLCMAVSMVVYRLPVLGDILFIRRRKED